MAAKKKSTKKKADAESTEEVQAPEAEVAPKQPSQNGITRPRAGTATGRVWEISDELSAAQGKPAPRAEVLAAFTAEGGNPSTGATQFGRWSKFHGLTRAAKQAAAESNDTPSEDAPEVEE